MAFFTFDASGFDGFAKVIEQFGTNGERMINDVLHGEGAEIIKDKIQNILPSSGRSWKGKGPPAKGAQPFTQEAGMLYVEVKSRGKYNYLYFPDDGSNTMHHAGNQQFMVRGAENASDRIIELCVAKLTEQFN